MAGRAAVLVALAAFVFSSCAATDDASESDADLRYWLENMITHGFSTDEMARVLKRDASAVRETLKRFEVEEKTAPDDGVFRVLPYPGGRHPRIGFLEGAIDPHRDTKFSVFPPWKGAGFVVVDFPEALWCQNGLTYLAHTHIPTIWDEQGKKLDRIDWTRKKDGKLESRRVLPDGLEFTAKVFPRKDHVDMELSLENGSKETLSKLRTQICVLLKSAPEFNALTNENKKIVGRAVGVRSSKSNRWIVTEWERARPWNNERCPCMHSDPTFPDLAPGESATLGGKLFFVDGDDLEAALAKREAVDDDR